MEFRITGLDDVISKIEKLADTEVTGKVLDSALKAGGKVFLKTLKATIPVLTGTSRQALKGRLKSAGAFRSYKINSGYEWRFQEWGSIHAKTSNIELLGRAFMGAESEALAKAEQELTRYFNL